MLAYYHTGTACDAAEYEGKAFWDYLDSVYKFAPRASERRHFRGHNGLAGLASMRKMAPNPDRFFEQFPTTYQGVRAICEGRLSQFGPYFQLKICDYMDRCLIMPIQSWTGLAVNLPSEPLKVITAMFPDEIPYNAFNMLCEDAKNWGFSAAPLFDRPIGPPEIETFLCDWKRITKSRRFGDDVIDKRNSLKGYGGKAEEMVTMFPPIIKFDQFKVLI